MDECKPLVDGLMNDIAQNMQDGRGLHSSTFPLNLSFF